MNYKQRVKHIAEYVDIDAYKKHEACINAWIKGEEILHYKTKFEKWIDTPAPMFFIDDEYKIKEAPKLIPFTLEDNIINRVIVHNDSINKYSILSQYIDGIIVASNNGNLKISYNMISKNYKFDNGEPCGKYE